MKHADFLDDAADLTQRETDSLVSSARERAARPIPTATMQLLGGRRDDGGGGQQQQRQGGHQGGGQQQRGGGQRNEYAEQTGRGNRTQQQRHAPRDNGFESGGGRGPDGFEDDVPFMSAQHHRLDHAF
ncbi:hypothetical protein [Ralstonia phage RPZH6]|nr:hypothetical protein [Ralstonia phage RPZH6]